MSPRTVRGSITHLFTDLGWPQGQAFGVTVHDAGGHMDQRSFIQIVDRDLPAGRLIDSEAEATERGVIEADFLLAAHVPGAYQKAGVVEIIGRAVGFVELNPIIAGGNRRPVPGFADNERAQLAAFDLAARILPRCEGQGREQQSREQQGGDRRDHEQRDLQEPEKNHETDLGRFARTTL